MTLPHGSAFALSTRLDVPMKPILLVVVLAACLGAGWLVYESSLAASDAKSQTAEAEPTAVRIDQARREVVEDRIELVGSLEPRATVEVRAAVAGYIVRLPFDLGDHVEKDAVVAELDDSQAREAISQADAALKVAQARLKAQQATASHSRNELERWQQLARSGVSTGQQLDAALAAVAVADSQVELEQAQVEQVTAELEQARLASRQLQIRAPASGYVAARLVSVGHLATSDLPLLRLVSIDTVHTVVHVPEQDYERVRIEQPATVRVDALPDRSFVGKVVRKAPVLDPATRTAAVEIEIPNRETLLKPGMHGRVSVLFDKREATVVPLAAVREVNEGRVAYVVSKDLSVAERVPVKVGVTDDGLIEILEGIQPGERIVTLGHESLDEGGPIEIVTERQTARLVADEARDAGATQGGPG